jgi:uncharacterized membrane protein
MGDNRMSSNKNAKNNKTKNNKSMKIVIAAGLTVVVLAGILFMTKDKGSDQQVADNKTGTIEASLSETGDMIIPVADITEDASFFEYDADGTKLEVIAIKAPDGSIRTAFNTCQVCYSSGRGYYVQEGDSLVCQNCGNRFGANDVEVTKGGCNPVPILAENKTVDKTNITISKDYLEKAKVIFENWKA